MNRYDPAYIQAVVRMKPREDDPKDRAIREKIEIEVLREPWAREVFVKLRERQIAYAIDVIGQIDNPKFVHDRTQVELKVISDSLRSHIVEGAEFLDGLAKGTSVLIMTNHFGGYKLAGINPQSELGVEIPGYDFMYPSPLYFAALQPVAEVLNDGLYYVSNDFPGIFGDIHRKAGFVHVPPFGKEGKSRTEVLLEQTQDALSNHPNGAIVNFPEGGTSGKYSGLGPYDLDPFKTGGYVIASKVKIPIVHVAQYFHPERGMELKVFKPFIPNETDKKGYETYAQEARAAMQEWLDTRKA